MQGYFKNLVWLLLTLEIFVSLTFAADLRSINGREASVDQTGHQVSIRLRKNENIFGRGHICGGTLIKPNVVLTAAHCLYQLNTGEIRKENEFIVVAGTLNLITKNENTLVYKVKSLKLYDTFQLSTLKDDLAILYLDGDIPFGHPSVRPIEINQENVGTSKNCHITGWGLTQNYSLSIMLRTLNMEIVAHDECETKYGKWLRNGMLCASYAKGEMNACQGDSGGPLICDDKLVGIVSWGNECANRAYPGVYTDVAFYQDWINNVTANSKRITTSYVVLILNIILVYFFSNLI